MTSTSKLVTMLLKGDKYKQAVTMLLQGDKYKQAVTMLLQGDKYKQACYKLPCLYLSPCNNIVTMFNVTNAIKHKNKVTISTSKLIYKVTR